VYTSLASIYTWTRESIGSGFGNPNPLLCCVNFSKEDAIFCKDKTSGVLVCNDTWTRLACTPRWANMYTCIEESIVSGFCCPTHFCVVGGFKEIRTILSRQYKWCSSLQWHVDSFSVYTSLGKHVHLDKGEYRVWILQCRSTFVFWKLFQGRCNVLSRQDEWCSSL